MPRIVSDSIDLYVFRAVNGRIQFLVMRTRDGDQESAGQWLAVHGTINQGESAHSAARRLLKTCTSLDPAKLYSADFVAHAYHPGTDTISLTPSFAALVSPRSRPNLGADFIDHAWCDVEETTARLAGTSRRWAVRHVNEVIALGGESASQYEIRQG